jgi:hypothetical protein
MGWSDNPVTEDFDPEEFGAESAQRIEKLENEHLRYEETEPVFSVGQRVLVQGDPRRRVKTEFPWTPASVVKYLGRGSYLLSDDQGRMKSVNVRSMAPMGSIGSSVELIPADSGSPAVTGAPPSSPPPTPAVEDEVIHADVHAETDVHEQHVSANEAPLRRSSRTIRRPQRLIERD